MTDRRVRLVLFDIDGTLIVSGRAGMRGMNLAFDRLYGRPCALEAIPIAGRTDRAIVIDALRAVGVAPDDSEIQRLREAYFDALRTEIGRPVSDPSGILPGVNALLDALDADDRIVCGLLTGNFETSAEIKLKHFALWRRFRFGAFGDDHVDRRALLPVAVQRARDAGYPDVKPSQIVLIGDTPLDVDCATAYGARAIGVATGPYDRQMLESAGANLTVDTLEHVDLIMDWIARTGIRQSGS